MKESTLVGMQQAQLTARERLEALEKAVVGLSKVVQESLDNLSTQVNALSEVLNAVTDVVGQPLVEAKLDEKAQAVLAEDQKRIDEGLFNDLIAPADVVSINSIIAYRETLPSGKVRSPGKAYKNVTAIAEKFRDQFLGKKAGESVDVGGVKVEVLEIFAIQPPKAPPAPVAPEAPAAPTAPEAPAAPTLTVVEGGAKDGQ